MDSEVKIIISGCSGKMGKVVAQAVKNFENCRVVGGIALSAESCEFPVFSVPDDINVECDVIIDFSHPNAIIPLLNYCKAKGLPCVIGTTGFSEVQIDAIKRCSESIPIFMSSNMSLGVHVLREIAEIATSRLGKDFDIEIVEKHHNKKIDAPSGTALTLAEAIKQVAERTQNMKMDLKYDRHIAQERRSKNEIGIHSIRGGTINGDHEVIFAGNGEVLTISHHAESKEIFAVGAIKAALFLNSLKSKRGMYSVKDLFSN